MSKCVKEVKEVKEVSPLSLTLSPSKGGEGMQKTHGEVKYQTDLRAYCPARLSC